MLQRHSTLFGFLTTAITIVAVGQLSRWSPFWMALTGVVGTCVFPRFFYGFDRVRELEAPQRASYERPDSDRFTFQDLLLGKWGFLTAIAFLMMLIPVGVMVQMLANNVRLMTGPHAWFVISSVPIRYARQIDSAWDGPFATKAQCDDAIRRVWPGDYCRDILISDAKAIWHGAPHDDWADRP